MKSNLIKEKVDYDKPRLLTQEEKEILENNEYSIEILEDRPTIMYYSGWRHNLQICLDEFPKIKQMINTGKAVISYEKCKEEETPTLDTAIDLIVQGKNLHEYLLNKFRHIQTNRSAMSKNPYMNNKLNSEEEELFRTLAHYNSIDDFMNGFTAQRSKIRLTNPPELYGKEYGLCSILEYISVMCLEPMYRSSNFYQESGLDPNNPIAILKDKKRLKKAIELETKCYDTSIMQYTIDSYFGGDAIAFQKRWREFYENWWPKEYQKMQNGIDKIKNWLTNQKLK